MKKNILYSSAVVALMAASAAVVSSCGKDEVAVDYTDNTVATKIIIVRDAATQDPIAGASVTSSTGASATTNDKGEATFQVRSADIAGGGIRYTVSKDGYAAMYTNGDVSLSKTDGKLVGVITLRGLDGSITSYSGTLVFKLDANTYVDYEKSVTVTNGSYTLTGVPSGGQSVTLPAKIEQNNKTYTLSSTYAYTSSDAYPNGQNTTKVYVEQATTTAVPLAVLAFTGSVPRTADITITFNQAIKTESTDGSSVTQLYIYSGGQIYATWNADKTVATFAAPDGGWSSSEVYISGNYVYSAVGEMGYLSTLLGNSTTVTITD
jgi:hypothetical protein